MRSLNTHRFPLVLGLNGPRVVQCWNLRTATVPVLEPMTALVLEPATHLIVGTRVTSGVGTVRINPVLEPE